MELEKENKQEIVKIILASVLLLGAWIESKTVTQPMWVTLLVYLIPYLVVGFEVIKESIEDLLEGEVFSEDLLMVIATLGALGIGFLPNAEPEFTEAVFVMIFFKIGELFEEIAEGNSRKSISHLMDIRPDSAEIERDGKSEIVSPEKVEVGQTIIIRPGAKVPMDGVVLEGESSLNTVAITGESVPRKVSTGEEILSGCVNLSGLLRVKVQKPFSESTASKILSLVEEASEKKSTSENFISKFAKIYTPTVVVLALCIAILPTLLGGGAFSTWLLRALTFLVVSCPCALVISVPLTFFGGLGGASKAGILIKGSNYMETLSKLKTVVFDKTGTLTHGVFEVTSVHSESLPDNELLNYASAVEKFSNHPIAISIRKASNGKESAMTVTDVKEIAGHGIQAMVDGKAVCVGNSKMMNSVLGNGAKDKWLHCEHSGTVIHICIDGVYAGHFEISDVVKDDARKGILALKDEGIHTVMLTGDRENVAEQVAVELSIDEHYSELLPQDKVSHVELLLKDNEGTLAFVGDGINDAPVLARADVGIAMGALGSDAAIEAADVVLMDDNPTKIAKAIRIARKTISIAWQNIIFSIAVKVAVLVFAAFGLAPLALAIFADVGVMIIAVLNATRALKVN